MALPTSRNTTYGSASPVKSADLNALQDCVIGRKKPPWTRVFWPKFLTRGATLVDEVTFGLDTFVGVKSTGSAIALVEIPCEVGDRITGLKYDAIGNGAADCTAEVYYSSGPGVAGSLLSTNNDVNRAAAWGQVVMPSFTPQIVGATGALWLALSINAANYQVSWMYGAFDRL